MNWGLHKVYLKLFPSPYGEEVLKDPDYWSATEGNAKRFPSPYGEEVLKGLGMPVARINHALWFPSPYGEEVLKDFAYNSIPDRDFRGQIDTPLNFFVISSL